MAENTINGIGIHQGDLVDLLLSIHTKYTALLAKLDADSVVAATDYGSACVVSFPSYIQTTGPKCIRNQGDVVQLLSDLNVGFNAMLVKVDADVGVGIDDDYSSLLALTNATGGQPSDGASLPGGGSAEQGSIVKLLKNFISNFNTCLTKLDTDPLGDSDYSSSLAITDNVDSQACELRPLSHDIY